jgi:hypothetical protein
MAAVDLQGFERFVTDSEDSASEWVPAAEDGHSDGHTDDSGSSDSGEEGSPVNVYEELELAQRQRTPRAGRCQEQQRCRGDPSPAGAGFPTGDEARPRPIAGRRLSDGGVHLYSNPYPLAGHRPPLQQPTRGSRRNVRGEAAPGDLARNSSQVRHVLHDITNRDLGGEHRQSTRLSRRRDKLKKNGNWSNDQLRQGIAAVDNGMSMKKAAETYGIPYSSFRDWCYGRTSTRLRGARGVLTGEEEEQIVQYLIDMCDRGYGLSPTQLKMKVYEITKNRWTPFKNGIPGGGWMRWWRHRHPELTLRASQVVDAARAKGLCPSNVATFYDNLEQLHSENAYPPERVWNCDESGAQAGKEKTFSTYHN